MILSAMMFALGVFVTGLLALGFCVALVRRTRSITERRLMGAVSLRRSEFEAERDELRARHAIEVHRLEREIARVLDMATAHRLDADVKDRDLLSIRAELEGKDEEIEELRVRLEAHRQALQETERKHAESSISLRSVRHALKLESRRRVAVEDTFDEALATADEKRVEISALQAQIEALRLSLRSTDSDAATIQAESGEASGSVVQLPVRETVRRLPRMADQDPLAPVVLEAVGNEEAAGTQEPPPEGAVAEAEPRDGKTVEDPETLFVEALAEIRALKRAAADADAAE